MPERFPRLPAEWEPQSAVMLTWPHPGTDWRTQLEQAEALYVDIASHITRYQQLLVVCHDTALSERVERQLVDAGIPRERLTLSIAPCNDTWARDHGPLTLLTRSGPMLMDFHFNGWGGKFVADLDDRISAKLHAAQIFPKSGYFASELVLEGGAVETDGAGTLLAIENTILTDTRNPGISRTVMESLLAEQLGFDRFLWLKHGQLTGDDTDGHIDTLARFCDPQTIVHVTCFPDDPDYPEIQAMIEELKNFRTRGGTPYRLVPLPPTRPQFDEDGERLATSYANFLIINQALLLPVYHDPADSEAVACLRACFPGREIIPIDCCPLIRQNGSLHCITMQFPAQAALA